MVGRVKLLLSVRALVGLFGLLLWSGAHAQNPNSLPACLPEKQGVPSAAILSFVDRLEQEVDAVHSFMLFIPKGENPAASAQRATGSAAELATAGVSVAQPECWIAVVWVWSWSEAGSIMAAQRGRAL